MSTDFFHLVSSIFLPCFLGRPHGFKQQVTLQKQLDLLFIKHQRESDKDSLHFGFHVQLYSKGSGSHVQVQDRLVDAKAQAGSENGKWLTAWNPYRARVSKWPG